jgi:hypothetical protein
MNLARRDGIRIPKRRGRQTQDRAFSAEVDAGSALKNAAKAMA